MAKPIVLVHGAWHAKWCWKYITPLLEQAGHQVYAVNLPGHGNNNIDFKNIRLSTYVHYLSHLIQSLVEPVIMVGHSLAGVTISQVAENIPEHIQALVYVTAYIPSDGGSLVDEANKSFSTPLTPELVIDMKKNTINLKKSSITKALLYNLCTEDDSCFSMNLLQKEPYRPFLDAVHLTDDHFGKIKKTYIECLEDNILQKNDQYRMYNQHRCDVISIHADHSPFFSNPDALANAILRD